MKDNDKKNAAKAPEGEKTHDINKSVFQVGKELKKQREAELEAQQQEAVRLAAEREKKKRAESSAFVSKTGNSAFRRFFRSL